MQRRKTDVPMTEAARQPDERRAFERLKAEMRRAYEAPESTYQLLTAADIIRRNRPHNGR